MKKITRRAVSVLLLAALVIVGLTVYVLRYIDHGADWALYFNRLNSGSSGELLDRNGVVLASFSADENLYAADALTRTANYHVTGDYWGRTSTGILSTYWNKMQGFSLLTGTTRSTAATTRLYIDAGLNNTAYAGLNGQKGCVLVVNYKTGELVCMVSTPAIDPADPNAVPGEGAFINRALSSVFVPGSIFKLVTAAAAIETVPNIEDRRFYCEGKGNIAGVEINCSGEHYTQTFEQALANSCNVAFAEITIKVGQDNMLAYARAYGLLDGHTLDGIPSAAGSYPQDFLGDPELAWSGIGQSTDLVNPYAMLRYVAAIANGGKLAEPHLIQGRSGPVTRLLKADTADALADMMSYNVMYGYGGESSFPGLPLCAKTGTAELGDGSSHAWFVGYLLDERHPYAFVVLVENGGGGLYAAGPVANTLLQAAVR
jgi:peptidoglycan glycosyltransferase